MDTFKGKVTSLKRRITKLQKVLDAHHTTPITTVQARVNLEQVNKLMDINEALHEEIFQILTEDAEIEAAEEVRSHEYDRLIAMLYTINEILSASTSTSSSSTPAHDGSLSGSNSSANSAQGSTSAKVRLPNLNLPTYNGLRHEWTSFHDLFRAAIHDNTSLSPAQKLQYLKRSVTGEPALLIQSFPITDASYEEAWKTLIERYEDKREIIKANFDRLLNQGNLTSDHPAALQKLADTTRECLRAVVNTGTTDEKAYQLLVIQLMTKKLDSETRLQWERTLGQGEIPTMEQFLNSLNQQARVNAAAKQTDSKRPPRQDGKRKETMAHHGAASTSKATYSKPGCPHCGKNHIIFYCDSFKALSVDERWKSVKSKGNCFNCLHPSHRTDQCSSESSCKACQRKHHTLLHRESRANGDFQAPRDAPPPQPEVALAHYSSHQPRCTQVLLSTALIRVEDSTGGFQVCRAMLDQGSQASFMTNKCATRLGVRRHKVDVPLTGLAAATAGTSKEAADLNFTSCHETDTRFHIEVLILKLITRDLPTTPMNSKAWPHLAGLQLADPCYDQIGKIDILLGADIFMDLMMNGEILGPPGPPGAPSSLRTKLGWIVGGRMHSGPRNPPLISHHVHCDVDTLLRKFWELEEIPKTTLLTPEEKACEQHYANSYTRDDDGRFIVRLPFKTDDKPLGDSRSAAVRRLKSLERKHFLDPVQHIQHKEVLQGYLTLNHMEAVPTTDTSLSTYYLPHHAVRNESSTTTDFRVVFDGSAATTSGVSLNDTLMVGPKLQEDLVTIVLRFRTHKIAITADITKMYRQIRMHPDDVNYQRILWRNSVSEPIQNYRLLTATFGTSAAPYLAIKSLQQLAKTEEVNYPDASAIVLHDFYVDDLMSGASSEEEAVQHYKDLTGLLGKGCLELRKWSSNSATLLSAIPESMRAVTLPLTIDSDTGIKTLGLQWHPAADEFTFRVAVEKLTTFTKRTILSAVAKVFDPLGWLSPFTIKAKILIQELWRAGVAWDEAIPPNIQDAWMRYCEQLPTIEDIRIPRRITNNNSIRQELHGFCDASESAYAAVIFLRSVEENGVVTTQMISAKSKVAPVKQVSLPRLELCGAVVLVRLMEHVRDALTLKIDEIYGWTDSTIVLAWLASPPQRWKTFVANRVSEIQDAIPSTAWHHVKSEENPADCSSRGIESTELLSHPLWWTGPSWLSDVNFHPHDDNVAGVDAPEERTATKILTVMLDNSFLLKYSNLMKLLRMSVYLNRFMVNYSKRKSVLPPKSPFRVQSPTAAELELALLRWIRSAQKEEFYHEIKSLSKGHEVSATSNLKSLSPFWDKDNRVLRVGGRLQKANIHNDAKHQILLPRNHRLTALIISHHHTTDLHTGPQALLAALQQKYWIPAGRDVIRHFIRRCVICSKARAQCSQQQMGELPSARVTPATPFQRCGVDYAGPFLITPKSGRGQRSFKSYVALFICMVTRAIHLELVSDMTTEAFLAALHRFVSRRGKPTDIYSDCGSNFVGARRTLDESMQFIKTAAHQNKIHDQLSEETITWHFNPPAAPNFGGLWEAGVKSMKFHLHRVIGSTILTGEELRTLLAQVEACLNSRPMTELSSDPNDLLPLTPGHFLIGRPLTALPEPDLSHLKEGRLSRWQRVQNMYQHFWRRWSTEYLTRLQQRTKWQKEKDNVNVGDIVMLREDNLQPTTWSMGRIVATFPGRDGLTRVVTVKTATSELQRPVSRLCVLPVL